MDFSGLYIVPASSAYAPDEQDVRAAVSDAFGTSDIVIGDLNLVLADSHNDAPVCSRGQLVTELQDEHHFHNVALGGFTRVVTGSATSPDYVLCKCGLEEHINTSLLPAGGSDHCAVTLVCQKLAVRVDKAKRRCRWALKKALYRAHLNELLSAHPSSDVLQYSVQDMANVLKDAMKAAAIKSI
eukprot:5627978-Amphidinium_carterae.1